MLLRLLFLFTIAIVMAIFSANWLDIGTFDILLLSAAIAPLAVLRTFHADAESFSSSRSIIFTKYNVFFGGLSSAFWIIIFFGLYKYYLTYSIWKALIIFLLSYLVQTPFYVLLKLKVEMEMLLYPISLIMITLFFLYAL